MSIGRHEALGVVLRLALWPPLIFWLAWAWGWYYADFFLPLYRAVLDIALPGFGVVALDIGITHEYVIQTRVIAEQMILEGMRLLPAGFTVDASTPMYIVLTHPVILLTSALAWPGLDWRSRGVRIFLSLPFLALLEVLDAPLVLASAIHDLLTYSVDPAADEASRLVDWVHVMDGGGRYALALAAAFGAAEVHAWLARKGLAYNFRREPNSLYRRK